MPKHMVRRPTKRTSSRVHEDETNGFQTSLNPPIKRLKISESDLSAGDGGSTDTSSNHTSITPDHVPNAETPRQHKSKAVLRKPDASLVKQLELKLGLRRKHMSGLNSLSDILAISLRSSDAIWCKAPARTVPPIETVFTVSEVGMAPFMSGLIQLVSFFTEYRRMGLECSPQMLLYKFLMLQDLFNHPVLDPTLPGSHGEACSVVIPKKTKTYLPQNEFQRKLAHELLRLAQQARILLSISIRSDLPQRRAVSANTMSRYLRYQGLDIKQRRKKLAPAWPDSDYIFATLPAVGGSNVEEHSETLNFFKLHESVRESIKFLQKDFGLLIQRNMKSAARWNVAAATQSEPYTPKSDTAYNDVMYAMLAQNAQGMVLARRYSAWPKYRRGNEMVLARTAHHYGKIDLWHIRGYSLFIYNMEDVFEKFAVFTKQFSDFEKSSDLGLLERLMTLPTMEHSLRTEDVKTQLRISNFFSTDIEPTSELESEVFREVLKIVRKTAFLVQLTLGKNMGFSRHLSLAAMNQFLQDLIDEKKPKLDTLVSCISDMRRDIEDQIEDHNQHVRRLMRKWEDNLSIVEYERLLLGDAKHLQCDLDRLIRRKLAEGAFFEGQELAASQAGILLLNSVDSDFGGAELTIEDPDLAEDYPLRELQRKSLVWLLRMQFYLFDLEYKIKCRKEVQQRVSQSCAASTDTDA